MRLRVLPIPALLSAVTSAALKIPIRQAKRSSVSKRSGGADISVSSSGTSGPQVLAASDTNTTLSLSDVQDLIYIANITVGGNAYPVQMDTGSSDLWIKGPSSPLPGASDTTQSVNLTYGIGWAQGYIAYAQAEFADIVVSQQALLDVVDAYNPALSYNADGILGLGFDSLSTIDAYVNASGSSAGRCFLYNLFADNPSEPNFITFSLDSTDDEGDTIPGTFTVGETDPAYSNVTSTPQISTWPVSSPDRWTVLLDSYIVGNTTYSVTTTVTGAPSDKAVVLLDSGTSYAYAPSDVCDAIYGSVSGAQYDSDLGQYIVPCDTEINLALQFGGNIFPVNPLDISPQSTSNSSQCVGAFIPGTVEPGQIDWLLGDSFLRSVYTLYDFGDYDSSANMGDPYVQMLSLVNPDQASVDFHDARGGTPQANITYSASNSNTTGDGGSTTVAVPTGIVDTINKISQYLPAVLAIMALNAIVIVALLAVGLVLLWRRRGGGIKSRKTRGRTNDPNMNAMPMTPSLRLSAVTDNNAHSYQPVSMALTEDTLFVPPSPAFKGDGGRIERPRSVA